MLNTSEEKLRISESSLKTLAKIYNLLLEDGISREYKTYDVAFYFQSPLAISWPFIHLDSIFLHKYLVNILKEDYYYVHTARININDIFKSTLGKNLEEDGYKPVIDMWKDIYKSSVIEFDMHKKHIEVLYKRFEDKFYEKGTVRIGMGIYRSFAEKFIYINPKVGRARIRVDKKWASLLERILAIGDDTRVGWGVVKRVEVEEISDHFVIINDNMAKRIIPTKYLKYYDRQPIGLPYKPPYWLVENVDLCVIPGTRVEI